MAKVKRGTRADRRLKRNKTTPAYKTSNSKRKRKGY